MQYQLDKMAGAQAGGVVLLPDDRKGVQLLISALVFGGVGAVLAAVGAASVLGQLSFGADDGPMLARFLLTFGLVFMTVGLFLYGRRGLESKGLPTRMAFNNGARALELSFGGPESLKQSAVLSYDALQGFNMRTIRRSTSDSNGQNRYYYVYTIQLVRTDGGTWQLMESRDQARIQEDFQYLQTTVQLSPGAGSRASSVSRQPTSGRFTVTGGTDQQTITWQAQPSLLNSVLMIGIVAGFGLMAGTVESRLPGVLQWLPTLFYGIAALMTWSQFRPGGRTFQLRLTPDVLEATTPGLFSTSRKHVPLAEIETVVFHVGDSDKSSQLMILRAEERQALESMWQGDLSGVSLSGLGAIHKAMVFDAKSLGVMELLELESLLESQIAKLRGAGVR